MSFTTGNIIELKFAQELFDQEVLNILHYRVDQGGDPDLFEQHLNEYAEALIAVFQPAQALVLSYVSQTWLDLTDGIGYQQSLFTENGTYSAGDNSPSFVAVGLRKAVDSRITRPGSLRIAGITDGMQSGNNLDVNYLPMLDDIGDFLRDRWESDDVAAEDQMWLKMVVVGRTEGEIDLSKINTVLSVANPRVTSQTTRRA